MISFFKAAIARSSYCLRNTGRLALGFVILFGTVAHSVAQLPPSVERQMRRDAETAAKSRREAQLDQEARTGPTKPFPPAGTVCPQPMLQKSIQEKGDRLIKALRQRVERSGIADYYPNLALSLYRLNYDDPVWRENIGFYNSLLYVCFPELKTLYLTYQKSESAKQKKEMEAQRLAEEERNKPENRLRGRYQLYLNVKACFEAREGYAVVIINDVQMEHARNRIKEDEQNLLKFSPNLDITSIWKAATDAFKGSPVDVGIGIVRLGSLESFDSVRFVCMSSYETLVSDRSEPGPIKKDF